MTKTVKRPPETESKPRRVKSQSYTKLRFSKRIKHPVRLPSGWSIFKSSVSHLRRNPKIYGSLFLVYFFLMLVFVKGVAFTSDLTTAKEILTEGLSGFSANLAASFTIFNFLTTGNNSVDALSATYQSIILVITSLAIIWTFRQVYAGQKVTLQQSFYKSMYPLVPFLLVLVIIALQFLPVVAGSLLFNTMVTVGIATTAIEQLVWSILLFVLVVWSLYLVTVSIFALYVVTLPDMTPLRALRSAKRFIQYRRWTVMRKILFLPVILIVLTVLVMLPVIMTVTVIAEVVFFMLSAVLFIVAHSYMYALYRELLNDG